MHNCTDFKIIHGENRLKVKLKGRVQILFFFMFTSTKCLNHFPKLGSTQNDMFDIISILILMYDHIILFLYKIKLP